MMLVGGSVGTDWSLFSIAWNQDDGAKHHIVYVPANGYLTLVLDGQICTAQKGQITVSAQAGTAAALKAMARLESRGHGRHGSTEIRSRARGLRLRGSLRLRSIWHERVRRACIV